MEMKKFTCKGCGKEIEVPSDLQQFSCVYCGKKMSVDDFIVAGTGNTLIDCYYDADRFVAEMNRSEYVKAFEEYHAYCTPIVYAMDRALRSGALVSPEALAVSFADHVTNGWKAELAANRRLRKNQVETRDRMFIALYLIPMVMEVHTPSSREVCEALKSEWNRRFPKTPIKIGRYKDIAAGFRKKFGVLCFITTAVCAHEGKPDDCYELTTLRHFRDTYMQSTPEGRALVQEYYAIAPTLVTLINLCADTEAVYTQLREEYINPCIAMIEQGAFSQCQAHYVKMVRSLQEAFCFFPASAA